MRTLPAISLFVVAIFLFAGCAGTNNTTTTTALNPYAAANPFTAPSGTTTLVGSGATFPKPLVDTWGIQFAKSSTVQASYTGGGSGKGITDITAKDVPFAGSDAPLSVAEKDNAQKAGEKILQFPETLGVIGAVYNIPGVSTGIKLTGDVVGKIYAGAITKWNDVAITGLNPGVAFPANDIAIAYRSDSSGTTFVFTDYLSKVSTTFASKITDKAAKAPTWSKSDVPSTRQVSGAGNDGVSTAVKDTPNSIGYVELAYVYSKSLNVAMMQSKDGEFLTPTTAGGSKAAASLVSSLPAPDGDWSKVSIVNAPGAGSYPIASFSYILLYQKLADYNGKISANQQAALKTWLWWCIHDGQIYSEPLGYAPLPSSVVTIGENALKSLA